MVWSSLSENSEGIKKTKKDISVSEAIPCSTHAPSKSWKQIIDDGPTVRDFMMCDLKVKLLWRFQQLWNSVCNKQSINYLAPLKKFGSKTNLTLKPMTKSNFCDLKVNNILF